MEEIGSIVLIISLIILIFISAFFSGSETGLMSVNKYKLRHLANKGNKHAKRAEKLIKRPDRLLSLILIGNLFANNLAASIATIFGQRFGGWWDTGAVMILTILVLVFSEVIPKTIAAVYSEKVSFISSFILKYLMFIFYPLVWLLNNFSILVLKTFGLRVNNNDEHHLSTDELRTVVNEAGALIPKRHQNMLVSILDLENVTVDEIMIPRNELTGIDINDDWKSIVRQLTHSAHSRIVLYRDQIDEVVGMLRVKEAYRLMIEKNEFNKETLLRAADEIYFIPEGTPLNTQLLKFQRNKERIGLIVDEYGDIIGLVTLEDILEEIVGEFTTSISSNLSEEITPQKDGSFIIEGGVNLRELNKSLIWNLPNDGPRTLNGLILEHIEDIPEAGRTIKISNYQIEVIDVSKNRINLVKVKRLRK